MCAAACLSLLVCVAVATASPYYLSQPHQRQLYYPVYPQYSAPQYSVPQYSAPQYSGHQYSAPAVHPLAYRQFYYPQAPANLVAPVPQTLRYPWMPAAPAKQIVYYPGAPGPLVLAADEGEAAGAEGTFGSWWNTVSNSFAGWTGQGPAAEAVMPAAESPASSPEGASAATGNSQATAEKVQQAENNEMPAMEEDGEKINEEKPTETNKLKGVPPQYLFSQPQFFGNFGLQRLNPAMVLPSAQNGAVSSYLLLKNLPGVRFAPQVPQVPQVADGEQAAAQGPTGSNENLYPSTVTGKAALQYQKLLQEAQPNRKQKEFDDVVAVDADVKDAPEDKPDKEAEAETDKENDEEETGTEQQ